MSNPLSLSGLWEVCFNNFIEPHYFYEEPFDGCGWVFDDEYVVIHDFLLPPFFVAVQFLFTVCFTLCLIGCLLMAGFLLMPKDNDLYIVLLLTKGSLLFLSATCGLIAVIIFGARGDGRDWMPHWEHNDMGWAFALAVLGSMILYPASILYMIEARRMRYKRLNEIGNREAGAYSMDDRKRHHHTDI